MNTETAVQTYYATTQQIAKREWPNWVNAVHVAVLTGKTDALQHFEQWVADVFVAVKSRNQRIAHSDIAL